MDSIAFILEFLLLLLVNIGIGAIGFVPSFFVTTFNLNSFGLPLGTVLSLSGEIFGAILGFHLYRWGFAKADPSWLKHPFWQKVQNQSDRRVFFMVIFCRLIPFVPSGLVTAGAALTPINGWLFLLASSLGKLPAVTLEVAAVYGFTQTVPVPYQYGILSLLLAGFFVLWIKRKRNADEADKLH